MWQKSKLEKELRNLQDRKAIFETVQLPQRKPKLGVWLFFALEFAAACFAIAYGFLEWYIDGVFELVEKPIMAFSILDITQLIVRVGILGSIIGVNYVFLKDDESENVY